jgi:hypothetical protein
MPKSCITGWSRIRDIRHIRATVVMQIFCCRASKHTPWFDMQGKSLSLNFCGVLSLRTLTLKKFNFSIPKLNHKHIHFDILILLVHGLQVRMLFLWQMIGILPCFLAT